MVHHRGAWLAAIGQALANDIGLHPRYLWTLPMFHCNGWGFTWSVTLQAGTHVCLRKVEVGPIFQAIAEHADHASLRRADRDQHDRQRARGGAAAVRRSASWR